MRAELKVNRILVPIDLSEDSLRTAKFAITLAGHLNASVLILHVVVRPPFLYSKAIKQYYDEARKYADAWFDRIGNIQSKKIRMRSKVIVDAISTVRSIVESAEKGQMDMIIMGQGRRSQTKKQIGSVSNAVMARAVSCFNSKAQVAVKI